VNGIEVNGQNETFGQNAYSRTSAQTFRDAPESRRIPRFSATTKSTSCASSMRGAACSLTTRADPAGKPGGQRHRVRFLGREPFTFIRRTEERYQGPTTFPGLSAATTPNSSGLNYLPLSATFTVNYGGVINFGGLDASSLGFPDLTSCWVQHFPGSHRSNPTVWEFPRLSFKVSATRMMPSATSRWVCSGRTPGRYAITSPELRCPAMTSNSVQVCAAHGNTGRGL